MQPAEPQTPTTPSADVQASDAQTPSSSSDERSEGSSPGWWSRLFNRSPAAESINGREDPNGSADSASKTLSLTEEELARRVQAETDRREAKRAQEQKVAERKRLRDEDPWAYVQQERQEEEAGHANNQLGNLVTGIGQHYDRASIDPVVMSLPEEERQRILNMEGVGAGLDGRKKLVTESLKALEKHWKAEGAKDAETKLRRSSAFRKQIFSEFRGGIVEPELLPGSASSAADETVSALLRSRYGIGSR